MEILLSFNLFITGFILLIVSFLLYIIGFPMFYKYVKKKGEDAKAWTTSYLLFGGYGISGYFNKKENYDLAKKWAISTTIYLVVQLILMVYVFIVMVMYLYG